ncbi:MAG: hypothetical protein GXX78_15515 [Bacteroidales bacterium]|nr:hypothetical protein [Bacteroidales bacterium]
MNRIQHIFLVFVFMLLSVRVLAFSWADSVGNEPFVPQNAEKLLVNDSLSFAADSSSQLAKTDTTETVAPIFESPISYNAVDSMVVSLEDSNQVVYLYGKANLKYQEIDLVADIVEVNLGTKEIFAKGLVDSLGNQLSKPHFKQGTDEFDCTSLRYNFETQKGFVENVITNREDGKVHGAKAKMVSKDIFCMVDGKYSTCDADHPHFYLHISKGKLIGDKAIIAGRSYIVIEDFPLYFPFLPYGYIPTNKKTYSSGIILPSYGYLQDSRGSVLRDGGFYWAASDYFDVKLTGEIYSKGSWGVGFESRYKLRYKFSGSFSFNYKMTIMGEKGIDQQRKPNLSLKWSHSQDSKSNPTLSFSGDVSFSTSGYNKMHEYNNTEQYLQNQTNSRVSLTKKFPNSPFTLSLSMSASQSSSNKTLDLSLPNISFDMRTIQPFKRKKPVGSKRFYEDFKLSYSTKIQNSVKVKEGELFSTPLSKWKKSVTHSIPITLPSFRVLNYINVTPSVNYSEQWYFDYVEKYWVDGYMDRDPETGIERWQKGYVAQETKYGFKRNYNYNFGISGTTTLYGMYQMRNPSSKLTAVRHKLDLTLGLNYQPDLTDPRHGFNKMVQVDSLGRMQLYNIFSSSSPTMNGGISFRVANNIEMKLRNLSDSTGKEAFKKVPIFDDLSFGGNYNLAADTNRLSNISLNLRTKIAGTVLNISGNLNPYALDSLGRVTRFYMWEKASGIAKLGRITDLGTGFSYNFGSSQIEKWRKEREAKKGGSEAKKSETETVSSNYQSFKNSWSIVYNFNIRYSNPAKNPKIKITQTLTFDGSIDITNKWKANVTSGFDFNAMKLSHTNFSVTRDLHCWLMTFSFSPISQNQYYMFTLSANSAMLKDLKIDKRSTSMYANY